MHCVVWYESVLRGSLKASKILREARSGARFLPRRVPHGGLQLCTGDPERKPMPPRIPQVWGWVLQDDDVPEATRVQPRIPPFGRGVVCEGGAGGALMPRWHDCRSPFYSFLEASMLFLFFLFPLFFDTMCYYYCYILVILF